MEILRAKASVVFVGCGPPFVPFSISSLLKSQHHVWVNSFEWKEKKQREMEENRRVGVALDFSPCSKKALKWAVDNLVREGDYLILITIRPEGNYEDGEVQLWAVDGSRNFLQYFLSEFKIFCVVSWRISFTTAVLNGCLFICACV